MGDGWRKVLIRSQVLLWLPGESGWRKAKPREWRGEVSSQFWLFAQCREGLLGSGVSSDRSDAGIANIFDLQGERKISLWLATSKTSGFIFAGSSSLQGCYSFLVLAGMLRFV